MKVFILFFTLLIFTLNSCKGRRDDVDQVVSDKEVSCVLFVSKLSSLSLIESLKSHPQFNSVKIEFDDSKEELTLSVKMKSKDSLKSMRAAKNFALQWGEKPENQIDHYYDDGVTKEGKIKYKHVVETPVRELQ